MVEKLVKFFSNIKVVITTICLIVSGSVYGYNYLHEDYLTNTGIKKLLIQHSLENSIQSNLDDITDLWINQGYAETDKNLNLFETLIKVKESRIVALKARLVSNE